MKKILLIATLLGFFLTLSAQDRINRLSYSIADTSLSQTEQAHALYTWITHNIAYDVQQLNKGLKDYSPQQTVNRRKAVCWGYSRLYHALCEALDIESYIIIGYSKGFGYVRGEEFTRANHSWNAVYADSSWILVDPTWGSGSLNYKYNMKNRLKKVFNKHAAIKSQVIFIQEPIDLYFNISPDTLLKTHLPADAKWQLKEGPISYAAFTSDSISKPILINYSHELKGIRLKNPDDQIFIDALNSPKYNPNNQFDIAHQYYLQANRLELSRKMVLDSVLLKKLKHSYDYYGLSLNYLKIYRNIRRTQQRERKLRQKSSYRLASRSIRTISKIPTDANDKYYKAYGKFVRQEAMLEKGRLARYNAEIKLPRDLEYTYEDPESIDSLLLSTYQQSFLSDSLKAEQSFARLLEKQEDMQETLEAGGFQNDTILHYVRQIAGAIQATHVAIDQMDEYELILISHDLDFFQKEHAYWIDAKENIQAILMEDLEEFRKISQAAERYLISYIRNLDKLARLTGENEYYLQKTEEGYQRLRDLYHLEMETIAIVRENNDSWLALITIRSKALSGCGTRGLPEVSKKVGAFFNYTTARNEKAYKNDMKQYEEMRGYSKIRVKQIKTKIREVSKVLAAEAKLRSN